MGYYLTQPIGDSDTLQYLAQSRQMLAEGVIPGMDGLSDGSLRGDMHGALWPAYLAAPHSDPVMSNTVIRTSIFFAFASFAAAVIAVSSVFRMRYLPILALLVMVSVPYIGHSFMGGWRDAFRLANMLLLGALLLAHIGNRRDLCWYEGLLALLITAAAVQGHGISTVLVPAMVASWAVMAFCTNTAPLRVVLLSSASAMGFVLGVAHLLHSYYATGNLIGDNVIASVQVVGTAYADAIAIRDAERIGEGGSIKGRVLIAIGRDGGWPSIAGMLAGLLGLIYLVRRRWLKRDACFVMLFVWWGVNTLFVLGAFDLGGMEFGAWTALNPRYAMQWYMMAALLLATFLTAIIMIVEGQHKPHSFIAYVLVMAISGWQLHALAHTWTMHSHGGYSDMTAKLNDLSKSLPDDCRILSEDTGVNFYTLRPVIQLYSKPQREILHAKTVGCVFRRT
jgi:hypothetical protein